MEEQLYTIYSVSGRLRLAESDDFISIIKRNSISKTWEPQKLPKVVLFFALSKLNYNYIITCWNKLSLSSRNCTHQLPSPEREWKIFLSKFTCGGRIIEFKRIEDLFQST